MAETLRQALNASNPGTMADNLRTLGLGDLIRQSMNQSVRGKTPATAAAQLATLAQVGLDVNVRAVAINAAFSRGAANAGALAVVASGTTPATGQIAVAPNGDIVTLAADSLTLLDVDFVAMKGDYLQIAGLPVTSGACPLPAAVVAQGVLMLISATVTAGANLGAKIIVAPGTAAATTKASLDVHKANVVFLSADAATQCTVELLLCSAKDADTLLKAQATGI